MAEKQVDTSLLKALKARYLSVFRENGIVPNLTDITVVIPPLHGDHFSSASDYITVHQGEEGEKIEMFAKRMIENPEHMKMMKEERFFEKEAGFFNTIVPMLNDFVKSRVEPSEYILDMFPKCYFANDELIILENLAKKGYILLDKIARHDITEARTYMKTLAKYNAPSYILISEEKSPEDFMAKYEDILFEGFTYKRLAEWVVPMTSVAVEILKTDSSPDGVYALKIAQEIQKDGTERILELLKLEHGHICHVINHGDTWSSNHMFLPDPVSKKLVHHVLIDFQIYRMTSPNTDLGYYLFSSVKSDVRRKEWKNLLKLYYDEFKANVTFLKGHVDFSFEEFVADYKRKFLMGFTIGICMLVGMQAMATTGNLEEVEGDIVEHIMTSISKWAEENPERTRVIAQELIGVFQEYKELTSDDL